VQVWAINGVLVHAQAAANDNPNVSVCHLANMPMSILL